MVNCISGRMVKSARLECGLFRSWVLTPGGVKPKKRKIGICCFSAKHATLRSKSQKKKKKKKEDLVGS